MKTRIAMFGFAKRCWLAMALAGLLALAGPSAAQTPEHVPGAAWAAQLDQNAEALKQIETALQKQDLSAEELQELRSRAAPIPGDVQAILGHLTAWLTAVKARLDQLGPAPGPKATPENAQVTKERQQQQKSYDDVDALVKRAKLLAVEAEQVNNRIAQHQHEKFTHNLLERGPSIVNLGLWLDVIAETPHNLELAQGAVADWLGTISHRLVGWRAPVFWGLAAAAFVLSWPLLVLARRLLARESAVTAPGRLRKVIATWRVALGISSLPILAFFIVAGIFKVVDLYDAPMVAILRMLFTALFWIAVATGLARALLAPGHSDWRLVALDDATCRHAYRTVVAVAIIVAAGHLIVSFSEAIGAERTYQAALGGIAALCVALTIAAALWRSQAPECGSEEILGPRVTATRDWFGLLRVLLWSAAVAIIIAFLAGFMTLASFLADQILWVGGVGIVAMMSLILADEAIAVGCTPTSPFGRALIRSIGLRHNSVDQLAILLSGAARVAIFIAAILLVLAPWGIQSTDLPSYLHAAFFGFHVGDITISLASVMIAIGIFIAGFMATRAVERWLETRFLPHTRLDPGLRNAIKTSFGYLGFILALGFAFAYLGLSFEKLAIVAGALSVGIGFGLQSIVNNFVSGLILLWERAIRVGDWIVVGGDEGLVRRINVRSTEIETFDRAAVIVPNSSLITGVVKNYVRTDRTGRVEINIPVNPAANPEMARDILLEIAKSHPLVLQAPPPQVIFTGITASAFNFELYCFIADIATLGSVKSELNFEIYRRFKAEGLFAAPPPTSIVTLAGLEKFEPLVKKVMGSAASEGLGNRKQTG